MFPKSTRGYIIHLISTRLLLLYKSKPIHPLLFLPAAATTVMPELPVIAEYPAIETITYVALGLAILFFLLTALTHLSTRYTCIYKYTFSYIAHTCMHVLVLDMYNTQFG